MTRVLPSVLAASTLVAASAFAALPMGPNAASTVQAKGTSRPPTPTKNLVSIELLGESSEISNGENVAMSAGSSTTTSKSSSSSSGTAFGNGIAIGLTAKPSAIFGFEGTLAYLTKKFDSTEANGETVNDRGAASAKFSTVRATGMFRAYPIAAVSIGAGLYASEFVGPAHITEEDGTSYNRSLRDSYLNRFDFGPVFGARGEIPLSARLALTLDARYFFGLANLKDEDRIRKDFESQFGGSATIDRYEESAHTRDLQFAAGLGYRF